MNASLGTFLCGKWGVMGDLTEGFTDKVINGDVTIAETEARGPVSAPQEGSKITGETRLDLKSIADQQFEVLSDQSGAFVLDGNVVSAQPLSEGLSGLNSKALGIALGDGGSS